MSGRLGSTAERRRDAPPAVADGPIGTREAWRYVAARLPGWPMSLRTFEYHASKGHLPALRLGSRYLFWTRELDAWLASRVGPRAGEGLQTSAIEHGG